MELNKRLSAIIHKDKQNSPKYLTDLIKSDFFYLINNYFEVLFDSITVDVNLNEDKYDITIKSVGDRVKLMKTLPDERL